MPRRECLLEAVRGLLERTYRMSSGLQDIGAFVIGDRGYRELYARQPAERVVGAASLDGARTLVRETEDGVHACIYFPDRLIRELERRPPQYGLDGRNVELFATFVEEIDHLLCLAERALRRLPVSLFELELHANVSKYLVLSRFLAGKRSRIGADQRHWLRHHLFDGYQFNEADPETQARYRDARHWAVKLLDQLPRLTPSSRLGALRRFHAATHQHKLHLIRNLEKDPGTA